MYSEQKQALAETQALKRPAVLAVSGVHNSGKTTLLEKLLPVFNEEETEVFRRGRNAKKATKSKNASVAEYNRSTGFEAVLGFLYLSGDVQRISELLALDGEASYKINAVSEGYKP